MIIDKLEEKIRGKGTKIVFTEGWDPRVQQAAIELAKKDVVHPILLGEKDEIESCAKEHGFDLTNIETIAPSEFPDMDKMAIKMVELRRGKLDMERCRKALESTNYFGTMLVQMGYADGLLGGATYSTADTVRPALQLVKAAPGNALVSSAFLLVKGEEEYVMGDCSININPNADDLVEITMQTANTARQFGLEPKVALLSYSTMGSAKGDCVAKMAEAAGATSDEERWKKLQEAEAILMEDVPVVGIFQVGGASLINKNVKGIENHAVGVPYIYKNLDKTN